MKDYRIYNKKKYYKTKSHNIFKSEDGTHYGYRLYMPELGIDTFCIQDKVTKKKFMSEREALTHQLAEMERHEKHAVVTMSDNTVDFIWQKMLETAQKSEGTIRKHTSVYTHHIKPVFGNTKIKDLNVGAIKTLLAQLYVIGDGTCGRDGGYSYSFVESILKWFYWFHNYCFENKYMSKDQFKDFIHAKEKMPKKRKASDSNKIRILKSAEIAAIFNLLEGTDMYLPALISLCTGARTGENFALCWDDVNFATRKLNICKRIVEETGGILVITVPKTEHTSRDVDIPDMLYDALYKKRNEQLTAKKANPELWAKNRIMIIENRELERKPIPMPDFINVDKNGKYIKPSSFNPYAKKIRETICPNEIGVEDFSFYTFRKTHISGMASQLTELTLIKHTGHKKIDTIRQYYSARTEEDDKRISDSLMVVNEFYKQSMSLKLSSSTSNEKEPLYVKPQAIIPDTKIPLNRVPFDEIIDMYKKANSEPEGWSGGFYVVTEHPVIVVDCATLSPIKCYCSYEDAMIQHHDDLDNVVILNIRDTTAASTEEKVLEAFRKEHIILE